MKLRGGLPLFVTFGLILLGPGRIYPQVVGGTLSGTVTDQSGAVIPNGQISIRNIATGVARDVMTDAAGFYTAPNLIPGAYEVTATAPGFATEVRTGITLTVGAQQVLNLDMRVGRVTEKVQVAGEAPAVQLATSSISAVVNSTTVRELPLNGRSWTDLAALQPGVSGIETQPSFAAGADRGTRGFGAQISISGARPQQNNYRLDGISLNDYANGAPGSVLGGNLGVDAIQEFSVLTSNYSAEYGKTSGGVVNAITRSGTNQFHGSVYEFLRNSALDARNFFDRGTIPPFKRNQFGAGLGGPIRKDRTFIFGDYEGIRQSKGITQVDTVPSPAARAGNLSTGAVTVDASAQKYLGLYPLPNGPILPPGDTGIFSFAAQQVVNENFFTTRVDHKVSQKDSLFGTYMYDDTSFTSPDSLNDLLNGHHTNRQVAVLEEDHIFNPSLVNSVRFGFNRAGVADLVGLKALNPLAGDPSLGAVPGQSAASLIVGGLTPPFKGGLGGVTHYFYYWNSFQGYDDAFLTHGAHSLKFGAAVERMQLNSLTFGTPSGVFNFGSLSDFLTNHPQRFGASFPQATTPRGFRETLFGGYLQDDWRWRPNLTLNLGLRYEMTSVLSEAQGKITTLINVTDPTPHLGSPLFLNPTLRNLEPRVGFAWDPFHNGKTAVRGGFGIFDVLPLPYEFFGWTSMAVPFYLQGSSSHVPPGSFFTGAFPLLGANSLGIDFVQHKPPRNYVMQWNLNLQRELAPNLTAMVGFVGSRGVHQPFRDDDVNIVIPTRTSAGYLWPSPVGSGTLLNSNFGEMKGLMYAGNSFFDALEVAIQKRMSRGLQLQGSYTWGKSIDTSSATLVGDAFANGISSPAWFDLKMNRGRSDFNIGRTLIIDGTWQVPQPKLLSGPAAWLASGWELGGIYKANDGVPFTATFGTDGDPQGLNSTDTWAFPNRLSGPGCGTLVNPGNPNNYIKTQCFSVPAAPTMAFWTANCDPMPPGTTGVPFPQCFNLRGNSGRNILTGPGTSNLDFSVFKNNYIKRISESFNVQFRAEFFNILNHANFSVPVSPDNTDIFDSTGAPTGVAGLLTSTTTTAREIQFALKVVW
jgi:hypothetical protein